MITRLQVRNFKTLEEVDIPIGPVTVLIGPNNSGKTSALQALALWRSGLAEWSSRRQSGSKAKVRPGVTLNRAALTHTPVAEARQLWSGLRVNVQKQGEEKQGTQYIFLDVVVHGETHGVEWHCGLEFYYANSESIYCRPLRALNETDTDRMPVPDEAQEMRVAMLAPMSGLASEEPELQKGRIEVLMGEGQTAQVLRNLCFRVHDETPDHWNTISHEINRMFGVQLDLPQRDKARGTIGLKYVQNGVRLDLSSAGRGLQQTLLLLAHMYANPNSALLLDEPDAHLEILRQRQIYALIARTARQTGSQIIAASHSEVVLNEAADRDLVIAFVGRPHQINSRGSQVYKALREIGFDQYYQAELRGFVLYLEGATDLAILKAFARTLRHPVLTVLDDVFVHYVGDQAKKAQDHYEGLKEAKPDLRAMAVFDRFPRGLPKGFHIPNHVWGRREIENFLCTPEILLRFAAGDEPDDLVGRASVSKNQDAMKTAIAEISGALKTLRKDPWSPDFKVSDDFLAPVFDKYYEILAMTNTMRKTNFHLLANYILPDEIDPEVTGVLDRIGAENAKSKPVGGA